MVTLYENATHLLMTAKPEQLDKLSEAFEFQPDGYFYAPSYERWRASGGREGWDGYLRPLQRSRRPPGASCGATRAR